MKRIIFIVLAVILCVLTLCGCEKVQGAGVGTGTESGASNQTTVEIELDDSFPTCGVETACTEEFAEACFRGYFAPMILTLWDYGGFSEGKLATAVAYDCFEIFISERRYQIENYEEIFIVNDEYLQYYPAEIVESFLQQHLGILPEELRALDFYNSEIFAYERRYYGGIGKGNAEIDFIDFNEDSCTLNFSFFGYLNASQELCGSAKMAYEDGTFVLKSLSFD